MKHIALAATSALVLLTAAPASASTLPTVVDQQNVISNPVFFSPFTTSATAHRVQTFTAGVTGTLARIDVETTATAFTGFNLFATAPTATGTIYPVKPANAVALATATYVGSSDGFAHFAINFEQNAGTIYAFEALSAASGNAGWASGGDAYAGGGAFFADTNPSSPGYTGSSYSRSGGDYGFRTFVVDAGAGAVPEPATWGTMLLGFGGLGYTLRRRRAQTARVRFA